MNTTVETDFLDNFHLIVDTEQNQSRLKFFCPIIDVGSRRMYFRIIRARTGKESLSCSQPGTSTERERISARQT